STSLIATSALLCESALTGATLYLPPTPPRSLHRSIAICVPTAHATEPPAANGPEWSKITPIRTVSACALAYRQSRLSAAAAAAEFFRSVLREVVITFLPGYSALAASLPVVRASIWRTACNVNEPKVSFRRDYGRRFDFNLCARFQQARDDDQRHRREM